MAAQNVSAVMADIKANPGKVYLYVLSRPCGTPFYVGIGRRYRLFQHEREARVQWRSSKHQAIRRIKKQGLSVGYEIVRWFDEWAVAAEEECRLIAKYGRAINGNGCLTNLTAGGDGRAGLPLPEHCKEILRQFHTGKVMSAETRAKIGAFHRGKIMSTETRAKMSAARRGRPPSREAIDASIRANRGRPLAEDHKQKLKLAKVGARLSDEHKRNISSALKGRSFGDGHRNNLRKANLTATPIEIGGVTYPSMEEASITLRRGRVTIWRWLKSGAHGARRVGPSKLALRRDGIQTLGDVS